MSETCEVCGRDVSSLKGIPACRVCREEILNPCPHRVVLVRCRHPEHVGGCNENACPEEKKRGGLDWTRLT